MKVSIEWVQYLQGQLDIINNTDIDKIEFTIKGTPLSAKNMEVFKKTGLCNTDYVMCRFWDMEELEQKEATNENN